MQLTVSIDGTDVSTLLDGLTITKQLSGRVNSATLALKVVVANISMLTLPVQESEVIITDTLSAIHFRGFVTGITVEQWNVNQQKWSVDCTGLEYLLQNVIVNQSWSNKSDYDILNDAFTAALPEIATTTGTVSQLVTGLDYTAKDKSLRNVVEDIAALSGADWYITGDKALKYYDSGSITAAVGFSNVPG